LTLAIFLFAAGVALVVLEVLIPSFGLLTLCALACFGLSIWQASKAGTGAAVTMGVLAPILTVMILYFGLKYIPRTSWGRGLILRNPEDEGARLPPTTSEKAHLTAEGGTEEEEMLPLVGKEGVAHSELRPAGVALIEGQRVDVVTEGGMLEAGARIRVVAVEGNRVVVRQVRV